MIGRWDPDVGMRTNVNRSKVPHGLVHDFSYQKERSRVDIRSTFSSDIWWWEKKKCWDAQMLNCLLTYMFAVHSSLRHIETRNLSFQKHQQQKQLKRITWRNASESHLELLEVVRMAQRCQQAVVVASTRGQGRLDSPVKPNTLLKPISYCLWT